MSQKNERRAPDEPGAAVPFMSTQCGHDGGYTGGPVCPNPATVHFFAGEAPDKPSDWTMQACPQHVPHAMLIAYDWHDLNAACVAPGAMWQFRNHQGEGFCFWPEAEAVMHEELAMQDTITPEAASTRKEGPSSAMAERGRRGSESPDRSHGLGTGGR